MDAASIVPSPAAIEARILRDEGVDRVPSDVKRKRHDDGGDNAIHDYPEPKGERPVCPRYVDTSPVPHASLNSSN